ncbi:hypothetical protein AaE_005642 [Aphanomyces astaci]|uniref:Fibronectin type-III domain-containing protein n=1 Tax=Aphanomyces astaci TaxID=112090 RepID=A0A6A5A1W9_APHAT|nr:hypothetical protein AaE_005642 [Aphanomyces astaci]
MDSVTAQYGGRRMVPATSVEHEGRECVSVLTYNVMRQMHATPDYKPYCDPAVLTATKRKEQIFQSDIYSLRELLSYNADVLCLQEVDDFTLWWIFHTLRLDLNDLCNDPSVTANFAAKLQQDNVALVVALQPWEQCRFPSALCVANVQLASHPDLDLVRQHQLAYLCPQIEAFNADFHLPIVVAGSFNATPMSHVYHTMRTGRPRPAPEPPARMSPPKASDPSTSTITLSWDVAVSSHGPILGYRFVRRVNGSTTVGFTHEIVLDDPAQVEFKVTMLSAGNTYEFRIAARNAAGWSEYSLPSQPLQTVQSQRTRQDLLKPPLVLLPLLGMPPIAISPFKVSYNSGKTPRFTDGKIRTDICPRPSHLIPFPKGDPYDSVHVRGDREAKLVHFEVFDSAYAQYYNGGEPDFTYSDHVFTGTVDYIFYSKKELAAVALLSLPPQESLVGEDAREPVSVPDADYASYAPERWHGCAGDATSSSPRRQGGHQKGPLYMGEWSPDVLQVPNPRRQHHWLPNQTFSSDHVALMAKIAFRAEELAVAWN